MPTEEIPRAEWNRFFDAFSRQHEGWLATLEILGDEVGVQAEVHELPLEGISIAAEDDGSKSIEITIGKSASDHISHLIEKPIHVWLEQTAEGANAALEIQSADQSKALLRFRSPMPPEFVDGVVLD